MSDLNYQPAYSSPKSMKPSIRVSQFAEGYSQRIVNGINNMPRSYNLTFVRLASEIDEIDEFLQGKKGVDSFTWTPKGEAEGRFVCQSWEVSPEDEDVKRLTATFNEVYGS